MIVPVGAKGGSSVTAKRDREAVFEEAKNATVPLSVVF